MTRSDPNYVTAHERRYKKENPTQHTFLVKRVRGFDSTDIEIKIKQGFQLNQNLQNSSSSVIPEQPKIEARKLTSECHKLRESAIIYLFKHVFESPPQDKWAELHLIRTICDKYYLFLVWLIS